MPTIISHAVVAAAAGKVLGAKRRVLVWGALLSMLPDIDVVWFSFGMRYHDMLGHRGFTHSLLFALFAAIAVTAVATRNVPRYTPGWFGTLAFLFVCAASHGVLDAMTNGGSGIPFFFPFDNSNNSSSSHKSLCWDGGIYIKKYPSSSSQLYERIIS